MAESRQKKPADVGQAEVQKAVDAAEERGYIGNKIDPLPNSAHSLESGPDAPTAAEQRQALKAAQGEEA